MADTVGEFVVRRLKDWGIDRLYGYPGDGINGVFAALPIFALGKFLLGL